MIGGYGRDNTWREERGDTVAGNAHGLGGVRRGGGETFQKVPRKWWPEMSGGCSGQKGATCRWNHVSIRRGTCITPKMIRPLLCTSSEKDWGYFPLRNFFLAGQRKRRKIREEF
ncbi:hypothetical protein E2542_SST29532 [Spatholobus suberectus]|nr:hypothetical protein E2542_SST29532 [Spatholobus suberectus]